MRTLRTSTATTWRLLRGGVRSFRGRIDWRSKLQAIQSADVISIDVFGTLLVKAADFDRDIPVAVNKKVLAVIGSTGLADDSAVRATLKKIHRNLARQAVAQGKDPEISRRALYESFFHSLAIPVPPETMAEELLGYELDLHRESTRLNPEILSLVQACKSERKRVIAISDTYLGAGELEKLLRKHDFEYFDAIYASCDLGQSKFRGGLFERVLALEQLRPDRLLHIGDDRISDFYSARSSGIRAIHYRRELREHFRDESGFRLGYESLGPVFAAFCHLLLLEAKRTGVSRLAFIARDGDFLKETTARLMAAVPSLPQLRLDYVYLSRRTTALPGRPRLDLSALSEVRRVRAEGDIVELFFEYFGLERRSFGSAAESGTVSIERLLEDHAFQDFAKEQRELQTTLLAEYLRREGLFSGRGVALVDVGWRGSTQRDLNAAFAYEPDFVPLRFYYLALWSEFGPVPAPGGPAVGILADQRRSGFLRESAAWQLAFLIEAVCRASHGTVTGFVRDETGAIQPRLAGEREGLSAELISAPIRQGIRSGILAYLDHYGRGLESPEIDEGRARKAAQRRMLRLAFFPRKWELAAVSGLVQTEGHAPEWSVPLVSERRLHPLRSPRRWMAGLTSPWRAGYVAATGGYPFAIAFFLLEGLLTAAPFSLRRRLRDWALKRSGVDPVSEEKGVDGTW